MYIYINNVIYIYIYMYIYTLCGVHSLVVVYWEYLDGGEYLKH